MRSLLGATGHVVRIPEPHGPRGRRTSAGQPEQPVRGDAEELALEIVERSVERRLRRLLAGDRREALADVLERERSSPTSLPWSSTNRWADAADSP